MAIPDEPLTRTEQYLSRTATGGGTIPDEPLTRTEQYLNKIATGSGDTPEQPLTRMEQYLDYIAENGGGGGEPEIVLPSGYTKLDYAESSGTQLINTGVCPSINTEVCVSFIFVPGTFASYSPPTGARNPAFTIMSANAYAANATTGNRYWAIGNKLDFTLITESPDAPGGNYAYQEQYAVKATLNKTQAKLEQKPFLTKTAAVPDGMIFTPNENARIGIFGAYDSGGSHRFCPIRFFHEWIYDDGVLIRDFVPALEDSTEEVGLFDLVNNVFYRNVGTGVLTGGTA